MQHRNLLISLLIALATGIGCADADLPSPPEEPTVVVTQSLEAVAVLDSGHWSQILACSGFCYSRYNFWVDIGVRNDGFQKEVGVVWTQDGWQSSRTTFATYERTRDDGLEIWGLDVVLGDDRSRPADVEYAVFARMNGQVFWDSHNNHYIYDRVTPEAPVRRLRSEVHYEAGVGGVMTGRVRVYDLAFEKRVVVRYSTDDWATWQEANATWLDGHDWTFRVAGLGLDPLPPRIVYAIRYEVAGQEFWDSNQGRDYVHTLAPVLDHPSLDGPISGWFTFWGSWRSDIPLTGTRVRLDAEPWQTGTTLIASTVTLADGAHSVTWEIGLEGGYVTTRTVPFEVANVLAPGPTWSPVQGTAWDLDRASDGRTYLLEESRDGNQVVRFDTFGGTAEQRYDGVGYGLAEIAAEADGTVWGATVRPDFALVRWRPDGSLDASFGQGGVRSLAGELAGLPICYIGDLALDADAVVLIDTCNERVLRFDRQGALIGAVTLPHTNFIPSALHVDTDGIWVAQADVLTRLSSTLAVQNVVTFPEGVRFNSARGLTRTDDGLFWAGNGVGAIVAFDADGDMVGSWLGGSDERDAPGAFHLPQAVVRVDGETVGVLGAAGARVATFGLR